MATNDMGVKSLRIAAEFFNNQRVHDETVQLAIQMVNPLAKALGHDLTTDAAWVCRETIGTLVKSIQDGSFSAILAHAVVVEPLKKIWGPLAKMGPDARGNELTHAATSPEHTANTQEGEHPAADVAGLVSAATEEPTGGEGGHVDGVHPGGASSAVAHSVGFNDTNMFPGGHGAPVHMYGSMPVAHNAQHAGEMIDAHNQAADAHGDTIHSHAVCGGYDHNGNPTTSVMSHMTGADGSVMLHSKTDGSGVGSTAAHMWGAHHEHASTKMAKSIGAKPAHFAAKAALHKFHAHCAMMTGVPMGKTAGFEALKKSWIGSGKDGIIAVNPLLKAGPAYYELLIKKEFSDKRRKELAASGAAMPDGSYPIENTSDLHNAIQAFGRSPDNATKAHIKKRAAALGASGSLPDNWK